MSWLVTVLLMGQISSGGDFAGDRTRGQSAPPRPTPISVGESETAPQAPALRDDASPSRATVSGLQEPPLSAETSGKWNRNQPSIAAQPAVTSAISASAQTVPANEALQAAVLRLEELLTLDDSHERELRNVRLVEALSRNADPSLQANTIADYWELSRAAGRARFASSKVILLEEVPQPKDETDRALLEAALAAAAAEDAAAQDELLAAQYRLVRSTAIPWDTKLPWPADVPFVGAYRTSLESLFANRSVPVSLQYLHECLPGKLRLIERRVIAMAAAEAVVDVTLESYKRGAASVTSVLQSVQRLDESRTLFLSSVIDYNGRIAEYSLAAIGPALPAETLVSTLIKTVPNNSAIANTSRPSLPRDTVPGRFTDENLTSDRSVRTNSTIETNLRDVHPASVETPAIQPDQRILRR